MSHTTKYGHKIVDIDKFCEVAKSKGYNVINQPHTVNLYGSNNVKAVASIKIDGWKYAVAVNDEGELLYDHFGSKAGTMERLGALVQEYNEAVTLPAVPYEELENWDTVDLPNGDRKLIMEYAD
jgi:hypothetical protein